MNAKKRQRQNHDDIWTLFVRACGGRCCVCGDAADKLQRGHIHRHADGGSDDLSNLIPVCKKCNGLYSHTLTTPDNRPAEWSANLIRLMMQHLGIGIKWLATFSSGAPLTDAVSIENVNVIPLEQLIFVPGIQYLPASHTPASTPSPDACMAATSTLLRLGRDQKVSIPLPTKKTLDAMNRLARVHGIQTFLDAGKEFIRQKDWFGDNGERLARRHEWEMFTDNFSTYHGDFINWQADQRQQDENQRRIEEQVTKEAQANAILEGNPEYKKQQEAARLAAEKVAQERRDTRTKEHLINLCNLALEEANSKTDWEDDGRPRSRAFYAMREMLRTTMRDASTREDLEALKQKFDQLMAVFKNPPADPSQGAGSEEEGGVECTS